MCIYIYIYICVIPMIIITKQVALGRDKCKPVLSNIT